MASLSLYDLHEFIGKHKDFQELLVSQPGSFMFTGIYFLVQLKLVCKRLVKISTGKKDIFNMLKLYDNVAKHIEWQNKETLKKSFQTEILI